MVSIRQIYNHRRIHAYKDKIVSRCESETHYISYLSYPTYIHHAHMQNLPGMIDSKSIIRYPKE